MENIAIQKSIFQNYAEFKVEFHKNAFSKSGYNSYGKFKYFELADFSDKADEVLLAHNLVYVGPTWEMDAAGMTWVVAKLYDTSGLQSIDFRHPYETSTTSNNPIQNSGADITYWRRFMKGMVCELLENDVVDASDNTKVEKKSNLISNDMWLKLNKYYTKEEIKEMYKELAISNGKMIPMDYAEKKIADKSVKDEDIPNKDFY